VRSTLSIRGAARTRRGMAGSVSLSPCLLVSLSLLAAGCDLTGKPADADIPKPAGEVMDFGVLYQTRCAGCHGADGQFGPAPPLNDPIFRAIVSDAELLHVIAEGRSVTPAQKTPMPAFAQEQGGPLSNAQIKVLAQGIKNDWGSSMSPSGALPAYSVPAAEARGNKDEGARLFTGACAGCHGSQGEGEKDSNPLRGGRINNQAFLALMSDQALRRLIITGRPDLRMPGYDGTDGRPPDFRALTSAQIEDLVALLRSWRQGGSGRGE
jgi:cytochrome c oxidase cbb3-type subunit 3